MQYVIEFRDGVTRRPGRQTIFIGLREIRTWYLHSEIDDVCISRVY